MNLLHHEQKMKLFSDNVRPSSSGATRWNIQDLVKRTTTQKMVPNSGLENVSSNRLAKKLVNIHQSVDNQSKTYSQVMPSNKELQKRIALDDCSNFLQQKGNQNQYPSATSALQNIISSNRSGSSHGFLSSKNNIGLGSHTGQSFKFNLTLNKNRQQQIPGNQEYQGYQDQVAEELSEDNEAQEIKQRGASRGHSQGLRQPLFKLVKNFEDIQNQSNSALARQGTTQMNKQSTKGHENGLEERQNIFEEEIIKRIQEIQKYTKNLHLQIKKIQGGSYKNQEEWNEIQQHLNEMKEQMAYGQLSEQQIHEILDERLQRMDNDRQLSLEALDTRQSRDSEQKTKVIQQGINTQIQSQIGLVKEDILSQITDLLLPDFKKELFRQNKDSQKVFEKQLTGHEHKIEDLDQIIDELKLQQDSVQRELNNKQDKLAKQIREDKQDQENQWQRMNDDLKGLIEKMKKQILKEARIDFDPSQYVTQAALKDHLNQFSTKLDIIKEQVKNKGHDQLIIEQVRTNESVIEILQSEIDCLKLSIDSQNDNNKQQEDITNGIMEQQQQFEKQIKQKLASLQQEFETKIHNQQQNSPQIDEKALESRLEQAFDDKIGNLQQDIKDQLEYQRNQINQRALRSEVQEIKSETDDQISVLKKQQKKFEEKLNGDFASKESLNQLKIDIDGQLLKVKQPTDQGLNNKYKEEQQQNLQNITEHFNQLYENLQEEVAQIKEAQQISENRDFDDKIYEIQQNIESIQEKISENPQKEEDSSAHTNKVNGELEQLKAQINQIFKQIADQSKVEELLQQNEQLQDQLSQIGEQNNEQSYIIDQHQQELEQLKTSNQEIIQQQAALNEHNSKFDQNDLVEIQQKVQSLIEQQPQPNSSQEDIEAIVEDLEKLKMHLKEIEKQGQVGKSHDQQQFETTQKDQTQIVELREQIQALTQKQSENDSKDDINALVEELELLKNQVDQIEQSTDLQQLAEELEQLKAQINQSLIGNKQQDHHENQDLRLENIDSEIEKLNEIISTLVTNKQDHISFESLKEETADLRSQIEQIVLKSEQKQNQITEQEVQVLIGKQIENVISQTKQMISESRVAPTTVGAEVQEQYASLKELLNAIQMRFESQQEVMTELEENAVSNQKVDMIEEGLDNKIAKLQAQLEQLSKVNTELVLKLSDLASDFAQQHEELKEGLGAELQQIVVRIEEIEANRSKLSNTKAPSIRVEQVEELKQLEPLFLESPLRSNRSNLFSGTQRLGSQLAQSSVSKKDGSNHHFLEDFSDAEIDQVSKDQFGNTIDDGDMLFNNKTNSLQNSIVMSNKLTNLLTPIGGSGQQNNDNKQQFLFQEEESKQELNQEEEEEATQHKMEQEQEEDIEETSQQLDEHDEQYEQQYSSGNEKDVNFDSQSENNEAHHHDQSKDNNLQLSINNQSLPDIYQDSFEQQEEHKSNNDSRFNSHHSVENNSQQEEDDNIVVNQLEEVSFEEEEQKGEGAATTVQQHQNIDTNNNAQVWELENHSHRQEHQIAQNNEDQLGNYLQQEEQYIRHSQQHQQRQQEFDLNSDNSENENSQRDHHPFQQDDDQESPEIEQVISQREYNQQKESSRSAARPAAQQQDYSGHKSSSNLEEEGQSLGSYEQQISHRKSNQRPAIQLESPGFNSFRSHRQDDDDDQEVEVDSLGIQSIHDNQQEEQENYLFEQASITESQDDDEDQEDNIKEMTEKVVSWLLDNEMQDCLGELEILKKRKFY